MTDGIGVLLCTTEVTLLQVGSTVKGSLKVCCSYCDRSVVYAVAAADSQNSLVWCSNFSSFSNNDGSYETYVAGKVSGCVLEI